MPASLQVTLDFLRDLRFNNRRDWFEANRARYEAARQAVEDVLATIIAQFGPVEDLGALHPKDCLYRIHRDVRFSRDKAPYKTAMGCVIGRGGRRSEGRSYYLHIEPDDEAFIAAGVYDPAPEQLRAIRAAIAAHPERLRAIIEAPQFVRTFGALRGEKLKTVPKGFAADHPAIDLLKHKQFLAVHALTDADLLRDDFAARVVQVCAALKPLEAFFEPFGGAQRE